MNSPERAEWAGLPGAELVLRGLADLAGENVSEASLLVLVAEPRLRALDVAIPAWRPKISGPVEHALYSWLEENQTLDAYSRYNSLLRTMNSFAHALERESTKRSKLPIPTD